LLLSIRNLSVSYGNFRVLDNINLDLPNAAIGLLGPNGAGKSTLIKAILGLLDVEAGEGRFLDFEIGNKDKRIRQYVGYMPESSCLIPGFNAVQYVSYCARLNGMSPREAFKRAHKVLYLVGLGEARYRDLDTYSTGMQQRLKLAQAIVHDPYLLFLDEPTNGLDPDGREEMLDLIRQIAAIEGRCIVLSSHLMRDVERCTEYLVIMDQQKIKCQGEIKELCAGQKNRYRVRVNQNRDEAVNALLEAGYQVDNVSRDEPQFEVLLNDGQIPRDLFKRLIDKNIQIRKLIPRGLTVEEVYRRHVSVGGQNGI
jgi:ABC-2 type transport system ATP-binding protein